jgi:hypothetical protein
MNNALKSTLHAGGWLALILLTNGCETLCPHHGSHSAEEKPAIGGLVAQSEIGGFTFNQTAEEAKETILRLGYKNAPYRDTEITIDDLLDKTRRDLFVGEIVGLERYDKATRNTYQVLLKFNAYYRLENITAIHHASSEYDKGVLQYYLEKYPMLVSQGSEDGVQFNHTTRKKEKITNSNYYFADEGYAFFSLNHVRTYKEEGGFVDVIRFNAHESNFAAAEARRGNFNPKGVPMLESIDF